MNVGDTGDTAAYAPIEYCPDTVCISNGQLGTYISDNTRKTGYMALKSDGVVAIALALTRQPDPCTPMHANSHPCRTHRTARLCPYSRTLRGCVSLESGNYDLPYKYSEVDRPAVPCTSIIIRFKMKLQEKDNQTIDQAVEVSEDEGGIDPENEITGLRLLLIHIGLCLCTFLVGLVRCPMPLLRFLTPVGYLWAKISFVPSQDFNLIATAVPVITTQFDSIGDVGWYGGAFYIAL